MNAPINRRQFITDTVAAATACSWSNVAVARDHSTEGKTDGIIDTHVYLGHWPHAHLECEEPRKFVERLRQGGIARAWAGSFDGLFHKDIAAVNERLTSACSEFKELVPFGSVNPVLPDWEDDLRRCRETHHMPGIRLHPAYHGYTLTDARLPALLSLAAAAKLIVQIVVWLDDAPHRWLEPTPESRVLIPVRATSEVVENNLRGKATRLVVSGAGAAEIAAWKSLFPHYETYFDTTRLKTADQLASLLERIAGDSMLFGSAEPLHPSTVPRSALQSVTLAHQRSAIAGDTARKLMLH